MNRIALALSTLALLALAAPPAVADDDVAANYKAKCQMCHGPSGKGDTPAGKKFGAKDFHSPDVAKKTDQELFDVIKKGVPKTQMLAYGGKLTDDQIKALVKYIRGLK